MRLWSVRRLVILDWLIGWTGLTYSTTPQVLTVQVRRTEHCTRNRAEWTRELGLEIAGMRQLGPIKPGGLLFLLFAF